MSKVFDLIEQEKIRQECTVELIASENFVSNDILKAVGSCLTNKYSEGYPTVRLSGNKGRYYGGCQYIDELEQYCCDKWKEVFNTPYHVNVQPHSGSNANMAAYAAVINPGDTILAMSLSNGGHLTHGSPVNFSGKLYNVVFYNVNDNGLISYQDIRDKILDYRPKLVLAGASAYSRQIDFGLIYKIIQDIYSGSEEKPPYFMVDMAHIAGLVATGYHQSPFGYADIVTTTTQKTLRGPRGGLIFCKSELAKKIDSAVFPGTQGGPLQHVIAGKAIAAEEACRPEFKTYIGNVIENAKAMANCFVQNSFDVVTGGTDNHMFIIDFSRTHPNLTGKEVQDILEKWGITLNKNCVPNETRSPQETSGVRIGTAAMTTKGFGKNEFLQVARGIIKIINEERN